ncbi:PAS and ANTAR domain-containing protein [Cellulomonas sp. Y8]|uniref:PAS and ANTAR domain-containing protein n=1 Tax=Cellulomonas sp. Y8 TaxID=2591145 RepID=UPI003D72BADA
MRMVKAARHARTTASDLVRSGSFTLVASTGRWSWSDEIYAIHGFEPHEVLPTTELVLAHAHSDDRPRLATVLEHASCTAERLSEIYRLIDTQGCERIVVVVGQGRAPAAGNASIELTGYFLDASDVLEDRVQTEITKGVASASQSRSRIDQAVGVVAFAQGSTTASALDLLIQASQDANVPLRTLARAIVETLPDLDRDVDRLTQVINDLLAPPHRRPAQPESWRRSTG